MMLILGGGNKIFRTFALDIIHDIATLIKA